MVLFLCDKRSRFGEANPVPTSEKKKSTIYTMVLFSFFLCRRVEQR
jgi:hypothetical protein